MNWAIEIQDSALEPRHLTDLLVRMGFKVIKGIEFPAFTSPEIDRCRTAAEAFEIAKRLRDAFTGSAQIDSKFVLGAIIDYSSTPPRRHVFLEVQSAVSKMSVESITITVSPPTDLSVIELRKWEEERIERDYQSKLENQLAKLEPAFLSKEANKVLKLLKIQEPSGETLYKIYELMEGPPKNRKTFQAQFAILSSDFNRFKDAVHNPSVSGDWARHAYHDKPKTNNPMSRSEAEIFVRGIAQKWLVYVRTNKTS